MNGKKCITEYDMVYINDMRKSFHYTFYPVVLLFAVLMGLDFASTHTFLLLGGTEGNPLMRGIVTNPLLFIVVKILGTVFISVGSIIIFKYSKKLFLLLFSVFIFVYGITLINNISYINALVVV